MYDQQLDVLDLDEFSLPANLLELLDLKVNDLIHLISPPANLLDLLDLIVNNLILILINPTSCQLARSA
jgi:hypothetical protein